MTCQRHIEDQLLFEKKAGGINVSRNHGEAPVERRVVSDEVRKVGLR